MKITTRKVFEDFGNACCDQRALEAGYTEQRNDTVRRVCVDKECDYDAEVEYLRQWLLANGAEESDGYVLIIISW